MRHRPLRLPGPQGRRRDRDLRGARDPTHVGSLQVDLHLPQARSLKDKRAVIRPILDGARHRFRVAAAEVAFQEKWQRASLGFATVGAEGRHVSEVLSKVETFVWSFPEIEVLGSGSEVSDVDA